MKKIIYNHLYSGFFKDTRANFKALSKAKPEKLEPQSIYNHILDYNSNNKYINYSTVV